MAAMPHTVTWRYCISQGIMGWRRCNDRCGRCIVDSHSNELATLKPDRMLEWAHSVIDEVEDAVGGLGGVPIKYQLKCDITAKVSNFVMSPDASMEPNTAEYQQKLIRSAVGEIAAALNIYCINRGKLSVAVNRGLPTLSFENIRDFKHHMETQIWFSVVHAALDEINITL